MTPRLFAPLELSRGTVVELDGPTSHHAIRVLRLGPGAPVELFDGRGQAAAATLISTSPAAVRVEDLHAPAGACRSSTRTAAGEVEMRVAAAAWPLPSKSSTGAPGPSRSTRIAWCEVGPSSSTTVPRDSSSGANSRGVIAGLAYPIEYNLALDRGRLGPDPRAAVAPDPLRRKSRSA